MVWWPICEFLISCDKWAQSILSKLVCTHVLFSYIRPVYLAIIALHTHMNNISEQGLTHAICYSFCSIKLLPWRDNWKWRSMHWFQLSQKKNFTNSRKNNLINKIPSKLSNLHPQIHMHQVKPPRLQTTCNLLRCQYFFLSFPG